MRKHGKLLWFCRFVGACVTAFIFLNVFSLFYSSQPVHRPPDHGATDFVWEPNKFFSGGKEGFSAGFTDKDGYNNAFPRKQGQNIDILTMGSSHMDCFYVPQDKHATYLLDKRLQDAGSNEFAYNIGITGHDFLRCASNLGNALNAYKPTKYVVIETASVSFSTSMVDAVLNGTYPKFLSHDEGILGLLQRFPYLRLSYEQLELLTGINPAIDTLGQDEATSDILTPTYEASFTKLIQTLAETAQRSSVKLVIVYHPLVSLNEDGSLKFATYPDYLKLFQDTCNSSGVIFADMTEQINTAYRTKSILPNGFPNTVAAKGHLNADGHRMLADAIYDLITKDEMGVKK